MKFAIFFCFLPIKDKFASSVVARSLTFDFRKLKLMCCSNIFQKNIFHIFCHQSLWIPKDVQLLSFFRKQHLISTDAINITKTFCD